MTDLLHAALKEHPDLSSSSWIIGGDFNMSKTFDAWKDGPRGNQEYLDRMAALGLVECLRTYQGYLTPTYRNPANGKVFHQMDHLFVSRDLSERLVSCVTRDQIYIFDAGLSDHLPIIADFSID